MFQSAADLPIVTLYAVPFFVLLIGLEWWGVRARHLHGDYEIRDAGASLSMGIGNLLSDLSMGLMTVTIMVWAWQYRLFDWGISLASVIAALIAQDFVYYWKHRIAHIVRWFWSAHVVHHSSEYYNLTTALRQPWNNHITGQVFLSLPLILLGVHPGLYAFVASVNLLYQFWIHTEAIDKMPPWFEAVMNTPSHHRVHHATNPRYLDSNFAGIFIVWDRLFGTFVPEMEGDPVRYGVVKPIGTFNPVKIAFAELAEIFKDAMQPGLKLSQRFKYVFAPPGYSHDGSRQGSVSIKQQYVIDHPDQAGTPGLPALPLTAHPRPRSG